MTDLREALRLHWGYEEFRRPQEQVVRSILEGRDVAAVMPTGAGKSLCYQLPAVVAGGTAVVVSPLIALMQDQVQQLEARSIRAAFLNSSLPHPRQIELQRDACAGAFRLLYLSPERLARPDTVDWLRRVPVRFFAIDEAHCISEWGHEFRPDYRQLSALRAQFPDKAIAAFTASATRQVRHDIVEQLRLRNPATFALSFHRPNLRYVVRNCKENEQTRVLLRAVRSVQEGSVIVYAPTIATVDATIDLLEKNGVPALPYHGQMEGEKRKRNQERWMGDEVRVLVGTLAFGLGINKPEVRAVIHLALPKSLEQYYQEAGRAGRDGSAADCVLLWRKRDAGLLAHFIGQIGDARERQRAWDRYRIIRSFGEADVCRHRQICLHFGETPKWECCGMCDACGNTPEWLSQPGAKPITKKSRERKGSTPEPEGEGTSPAASAGPPADAALVQRLKEWRLAKAKEHNVAAFVILHDRVLIEIARRRPGSEAELRRVPGIGAGKASVYGAQILTALGDPGADLH